MAITKVGFGFYSGLSTDTKPTLGTANAGVTFYETDSLKTFVFDGAVWFERTVDGITDAPSNGKGYGRKDLGWVEITNAEMVIYSKKITTVPALIPSNITDFAAVVTDVNVSADFWNFVSVNGDNITVTDAAGTVLSYDVVYIDTTTKKLQVRFKIDLLSSSVATDFYIRLRDVTYSNTPTDVYRSDLRAYWSCTEEPTGVDSVKDRTINGFHMDSFNMDASNLVDGKLSKAIYTDGISDVVKKPYTNILTDYPYTLLHWIKWPLVGNNASFFLTSTTDGAQFIGFQQSGGDYPKYFHYGVSLHCPIMPRDEFIFEVGRGTSLTLRDMFINDTSTAQSTASLTYPLDIDLVSFGGLIRTTSVLYMGIDSEIRIYNSALSDDEITTIYNNENNPASFWV